MKTTTRLFFVIFLVLTMMPGLMQRVSGQSVEEIKADREHYIWGEGKGTTLNKADQQAMEDLISQISVTVDTKFSMLKEEMVKSGKSDFKTECKQLVNTYSTAMLTNTERLVLSDEPDAIVFRYVARDQIARIFQLRNGKILDFTASADKALERVQIADALKYYYWALSLLRSLPDGESLSYTPKNGASRLLTGYLHDQINAIFEGLTFRVDKIIDEPGTRTVTLDIRYLNRPVQNFEYSFWDGRDFSQPVDAKDGLGFLEFYGEMAASRETVQIRAEYIFEGEARIDRELEDVLARLDPVPFRNAYFKVNLVEKAKPDDISSSRPDSTPIVEPPVQKETGSAMQYIGEKDYSNFEKSVSKVLESIRTGNYKQVKPLFTTYGFDVFNKLIRYGNAKVLENDSIRAMKVNNLVMCRGPRMSFSFPGNNRQFVEDVVFHFNQKGKIETLSFGLNSRSLDGILSKTAWTQAERMTLVNFLEHYKTAYALKRMDFISSIFADDAVIITGNVVKVKRSVENPFAGNTIVKYNRYSKSQYLKALERTFASNEFINLEFEESTIRKGGKTGDMFGVQIKQNYYSTNYGDQGYLFLLIDFKNPAEPLIHVRTWQPVKNEDGTIYGIEDF